MHTQHRFCKAYLKKITNAFINLHVHRPETKSFYAKSVIVCSLATQLNVLSHFIDTENYD